MVSDRGLRAKVVHLMKRVGIQCRVGVPIGVMAAAVALSTGASPVLANGYGFSWSAPSGAYSSCVEDAPQGNLVNWSCNTDAWASSAECSLSAGGVSMPGACKAHLVASWTMVCAVNNGPCFGGGGSGTLFFYPLPSTGISPYQAPAGVSVPSCDTGWLVQGGFAAYAANTVQAASGQFSFVCEVAGSHDWSGTFA